MSYRNDLDAAHQYINTLEQTIRKLKGDMKEKQKKRRIPKTIKIIALVLGCVLLYTVIGGLTARWTRSNFCNETAYNYSNRKSEKPDCKPAAVAGVVWPIGTLVNLAKTVYDWGENEPEK